jgi:arylsulfatase A-like enzyme
LKQEGIAENTLVVWFSDNGPMYAFWPTSGYSWLRGAKCDVLEGGVRVPAMAWWPGMIEPNQDPVDIIIIHVTDLYSTAARIAGAMDKIPSDRVTDGIDQTALLLLGEGHSRRNYMFHYSGDHLGAVAPYARGGGKQANPGEELTDQADRAALMKQKMPEFHRAILNYPRYGGEDIQNQFFWLNKLAEDMPTCDLAHRMFRYKSEESEEYEKVFDL